MIRALQARPKLAHLGQGFFAGASCGFAIGTIQTLWLDMLDVVELGPPLVMWAGGVAALVFGLAGAGLAVGLGGLAAAVRHRFGGSLPGAQSGALVLGSSYLLATVTIGRWRYYLDEHLLVGDDSTSKLTISLLFVLAGLLLGGIAAGLAERFGLVRTGLFGIALSLAVTGAYERWVPEGPSGTNRATMALARTARPSGESALPSRPHVILIVADSLRADALVRFAPPGQPAAPTPALDRFAGESAIVARACAQSSWTKPGFASILSGLPPRVHTAGQRISRLPDEVTTLPELFRAAGYFTLGHSNANPNNGSAAHFEQGFDEFLDLAPPRRRFFAPEGASQLALYRRLIEPVGAALFDQDVRFFYEPADDYVDRVLARLEALPAPSSQPLFLMLHFMDPHYPYMDGRSRGRPILLDGERHRERGSALAPELRTAYLGDIAFMDRHLGRLFDGLRALGIYDDALVVFTSDHGEEFYEHAEWGHGESLYREVIEIPLLVKLPRAAPRAPGGSAPDRDFDGARQIDIAPTVLERASLPIPAAMQGIPLLRGPDESLLAEAPACHSSLDRTFNRLESLRTATTTFIVAERTNQARIAPVELYDRRNDPAERSNRAAEAGPVRAVLEAQLRAIHAGWPALPTGGETMEIDRALEAQMRALGYVDPHN